VGIMTCWIAGWNLPGCLPEMDLAEFDTEEDAWSFIRDEMERYLDLDLGIDPYVYWVEQYDEITDENKGVDNYE
jgi:hypothetical protein